MINYHKTQGEWKIHLTMTINFSSSKDSNETRTMHIKSDNIEIIIDNIFFGKISRRIKKLNQRKWIYFW